VIGPPCSPPELDAPPKRTHYNRDVVSAIAGQDLDVSTLPKRLSMPVTMLGVKVHDQHPLHEAVPDGFHNGMGTSAYRQNPWASSGWAWWYPPPRLMAIPRRRAKGTAATVPAVTRRIGCSRPSSSMGRGTNASAPISMAPAT